MLNKALIEKQKLTQEDVELLKYLHEAMKHIVSNPDDYGNPVEKIEKLEYEMQKAWKFKEDRDFHTHWMRIKGCTCNARLDNMERIGTPYRIIDAACMWHGVL